MIAKKDSFLLASFLCLPLASWLLVAGSASLALSAGFAGIPFFFAPYCVALGFFSLGFLLFYYGEFVMPWLSDCCSNCSKCCSNCGSLITRCCCSIAAWCSSWFSEDPVLASGTPRVDPVSPLLNASTRLSPESKARLSASLPAAPRSVGIANTPSNREACAFLDLKLEELTSESLKKAYKRKALLLHPDKSGGSKEAFCQLFRLNAKLKAALKGEDDFEVDEDEYSQAFHEMQEQLAELDRRLAEQKRDLDGIRRNAKERDRKLAEQDSYLAEIRRVADEGDRRLDELFEMLDRDEAGRSGPSVSVF